MTRLRPALLVAIAGFALAALASPAAAQCAMCKTALEGSQEGQRIAGQFNFAILMMFFAPYTVFGAFVAVLFREKIRSRARFVAGSIGARLRRNGLALGTSLAASRAPR